MNFILVGFSKRK